MKKARFTRDQIIGILKEHQAGATAADLCRRHRISDASFYTWRSKYGGMEVSEARRAETGDGHALAEDAARRAQSALEPGFRLGRIEQRTAVPRADGGGRLYARMPGTCGGYVVVRRTARPRTRPDRGTSRLATDARQ